MKKIFVTALVGMGTVFVVLLRFRWKGENCDEYTVQLLLYSLTQLVSLIWCLFLMLTIIRLAYIYLFYSYRTKSKVEPIIYSGLFIFSGALSLITHSILILSGLINSSRYEVIVFKDDIFGDIEDLNVTHGKVSIFCLFLATSFFVLSSLQIFHTWHKVFVQFSIYEGQKTQFLRKSSHFIIKLILIGYIVLSVYVVFGDELFLSIALLTSLTVILMVAYTLTYFRLKKLLNKYSAADHEFMQKALELIKYCCKVNGICLLVITIFMIPFYSFVGSYPELIETGYINYILFLREFASFTGLLLLTVSSWYINTNVKRKPMKKGIWLQRLWDNWDRANIDLFAKEVCFEGEERKRLTFESTQQILSAEKRSSIPKSTQQSTTQYNTTNMSI